jgi:hypothetical protein
MTPEATLANSTTYTATVSGAKSISGVAMSAPFKWSFTTAAASVTTPTVMSTSPPLNAPNVDVSTPIAVNFNEAVLGSSISSANFTLEAASGTMVPATITYTATGGLYTATLTPSAALSYSTTYTATISGVKDAAGNVMASPYTWTFATAANIQTIAQLPLAYQSNLQYIGGFRVPDGTFGSDMFNYAGSGLAFDPANNSLFLSGYQVDNAMGQISIPSTIVDSSNINNLATASVLQPLLQVLPRIPKTSNLGDGSYDANGKGPIYIGGLMVVNGQLLGTEYVYYDNSGTTVVTHFRFDSLNLSTATVEGMFQVGNMGAGMYDGYMTPVPANWQAALGATALTGNCCLSILGRTSFGPAVFGFNPSTLSSSSPSSATPYVYYTQSNQAGGNQGPSYFDPLFDGNTTIQGVWFVPGTRSVLLFGSVGTNSQEYGEPSSFNDTNRTGKGYHSLDGDYAYQVWAYDANDFVAVEDGQMQPWQLQPYATWNLDFPQHNGTDYLGGVAFDPSTSRLYVTELGGDTQVAYSYLPVVQVFQLTLSSAGASSGSAAAPLSSPAVAQSNAVTTTAAIGAPGSGSSSVNTTVIGTVGDITDSATNDTSSRVHSSPRSVVQLRWRVAGTDEGSSPQSVFSRASTLLRAANRVPDRMRSLFGDGQKSVSLFGSPSEL